MKIIIFTKDLDIPETKALIAYCEFENIAYTINETGKVYAITGGRKPSAVVINDEYIGGFYDLVKYTERTGLRQC